jgi:hypothetical protein
LNDYSCKQLGSTCQSRRLATSLPQHAEVKQGLLWCVLAAVTSRRLCHVCSMCCRMQVLLAVCHYSLCCSSARSSPALAALLSILVLFPSQRQLNVAQLRGLQC